MTESDLQKLITEASQALDRQQYATAEELQRRVIQLLEAQSVDATRVENECEKLAGIHYQQGKFGLAANEYDRVQKSREALLPATDERNLRVLLRREFGELNPMPRKPHLVPNLVPTVRIIPSNCLLEMPGSR